MSFLSAAPTKPENLEAKICNATCLSVTWEAPKNLTGVLHNYTVSWIRESELLSSETTTELRYSVSGLEACVKYTVKVAATTGAGLGEKATITAQINGIKLNDDMLYNQSLWHNNLYNY